MDTMQDFIKDLENTIIIAKKRIESAKKAIVEYSNDGMFELVHQQSQVVMDLNEVLDHCQEALLKKDDEQHLLVHCLSKIERRLFMDNSNRTSESKLFQSWYVDLTNIIVKKF